MSEFKVGDWVWIVSDYHYARGRPPIALPAAGLVMELSAALVDDHPGVRVKFLAPLETNDGTALGCYANQDGWWFNDNDLQPLEPEGE